MKSGRSGRALATASARRHVPAFPAVAHARRERLVPEASLNIWMALFVPAESAGATSIERLSQALEQTMKDPAAGGRRSTRPAWLVDYRNPAATAKLLETEHDAVKKVVTRLGIGQK